MRDIPKVSVGRGVREHAEENIGKPCKSSRNHSKSSIIHYLAVDAVMQMSRGGRLIRHTCRARFARRMVIYRTRDWRQSERSWKQWQSTMCKQIQTPLEFPKRKVLLPLCLLTFNNRTMVSLYLYTTLGMPGFSVFHLTPSAEKAPGYDTLVSLNLKAP